jgi:hypothetical protein
VGEALAKAHIGGEPLLPIFAAAQAEPSTEPVKRPRLAWWK